MAADRSRNSTEDGVSSADIRAVVSRLGVDPQRPPCQPRTRTAAVVTRHHERRRSPRPSGLDRADRHQHANAHEPRLRPSGAALRGSTSPTSAEGTPSCYQPDACWLSSIRSVSARLRISKTCSARSPTIRTATGRTARSCRPCVTSGRHEERRVVMNRHVALESGHEIVPVGGSGAGLGPWRACAVRAPPGG